MAQRPFRSLFVATLLTIGGMVPVIAAEPTGTLQKINDSGTITLGYREGSKPLSFADRATKQPMGYSIDLCQRIVDQIKQDLGRPDLQVKYVQVDAESRIPMLKNGQIDLECGSTTNTLTRQKEVDFTNTVFVTGGSMLLPVNSKIAKISDLTGKKIAVVMGTTTDEQLASKLADAGVSPEIVRVRDYGNGISKLEKGEVDALAGDQIVLIGQAREAKNPGKLALATDLFSYEPIAFMVPRNDADFRLAANKALARTFRSGDIEVIYQKWFGDWGGRPGTLLIANYALNSIPE
jgi:glutamate/aspartate transport system substrate-binding protein